nr:hypothetical protein [Limosilactobacillus fermentum]
MAAARAVNHSRIWKRKVISYSKNIVPAKGAEKAAANLAATPHDKRSLFSSGRREKGVHPFPGRSRPHLDSGTFAT